MAVINPELVARGLAEASTHVSVILRREVDHTALEALAVSKSRLCFPSRHACLADGSRAVLTSIFGVGGFMYYLMKYK